MLKLKVQGKSVALSKFNIILSERAPSKLEKSENLDHQNSSYRADSSVLSTTDRNEEFWWVKLMFTCT